MKVNITVDTAWLCLQLSNIVFVLLNVFPVSVYTYLRREVFGEILVEILHIVMIELLS